MSDPKWTQGTKPLTAAEFDETWRRMVDGDLATGGPVEPPTVIVSPREHEAMMSIAPSTETVAAAYCKGLTFTDVNEARRARGIAEIPAAVWVGLSNRLLG